MPEIGGREWEYVRECLDTGWVSSVGAFVDRFEAEVAAVAEARFGVAMASGTAALHLSLLIGGVRFDDEVLVPALSFAAPANAVRYLGAHPVFIDAEPNHLQMDVEKALDFLDSQCAPGDSGLVNKQTGRRIGAILPVHVLGHPTDMDLLREAAERYGLLIVEDAAESIGTRYLEGHGTDHATWRSVGTIGRLGCLSFNGNKVMTTGGGGMIVTDDEALATRARYLSTQAKDDPVEYAHGEVGFNYRMGNVQAAIGCAQLERLDEFITAKRRIASAYEAAFDGVNGVTTLPEASWAHSTCWLSTILVDEEKAGIDRRGLLQSLAAVGVQSRPLWKPLYLNPPFAACQAYRCEEVERIWAQALSLPSSAGLSEDDQMRVVEAVLDAVKPGVRS